MSFAIVTDSASDVPEDVIETNKVFVIPTYVIIDGKEYLDNELPIDDLLSMLLQKKTSTTSQPSPDQAITNYKDALNSNIPVLGIHISSKLSGTFNVSNLAIQEFDNPDVLLFDSNCVSFGSGYFVLMACKLRELGYSRDQVYNLFLKIKDDIYLQILIDDIDYLKRGGRVNLGQYWLLKILGLKPILKNHDGLIIKDSFSFGLSSGMNKISARIKHMIKIPEESIVVVGHANTPDKLKILKESIENTIQPDEMIEVRISSTLLSHVGPNALGMMVAPSLKKLIELIE